jgi:two-component system chemotaxis response regulator CheB
MPQSALRHVDVDHCCKLAEMARPFVMLAKDDSAPDELQGLTKLIEIENHIAEGIFSVDDWWGLEQMSAPSGLNCPNRRSALYELNDKRVLRFRCGSGHAFSAESLLSGQADARETHFSSIFGASSKRLSSQSEC